MTFKKGHKPWNNGIKGIHLSPKTEFKKGNISWNKGLTKEIDNRIKKYAKKLSLARKGKFSREKSSNWKGGIYKNYQGYVYITKPNHPYVDCRGYVKKSRLIMEKKLGRYLTKKEVVHHINGIKDDDRIENLELFASKGKHTTYHTFHTYKRDKLGKFRKCLR